MMKLGGLGSECIGKELYGLFNAMVGGSKVEVEV